MARMTAPMPTLRWVGDARGHLALLDQTRLPGETVELTCRTVEDVYEAIRRLAVRGAPAIGVAAAYGVVLSLRDQPQDPRPPVLAACERLAESRPTAVNLFWALDRMRRLATDDCTAGELLAEARAIHAEDEAMCRAIGVHGADLLSELPEGSGILTHCNAGALATGGDGTALAVVYEVARRGGRPHIWVDETRPLWQGARLTAWELLARRIDCTVICDSAAAHVMHEGRVAAAVTGADRIAGNGDTANKIGTYSVALAARAHGIPFYVAAPSSTFDLTLSSGAEIPIEQRAAAEVTGGIGRSTTPADAPVYNPAFDVTPAELIDAIITERGVIRPVTREQIAQKIPMS